MWDEHEAGEFGELMESVGRGPVAIERHVFENIANAYRSACERIEAERDLERARFELKGHRNEGGGQHYIADGELLRHLRQCSAELLSFLHSAPVPWL